MPDISKCTGEGCPLKNKCYRHTATDSKHRQAYFVVVPFNKDKETCSHFWENPPYVPQQYGE